ncbi:tripartite tricarboxylate transporter substrate binding protein [Pseudorhodoferax sp.]|uniref:tripartite tricarboxylate transporter substrate binding protein n=1 Tax=Pseudorhodoferax sp. TaxID=1993553 RepID=UPI002DD69127|nr:tripartite tricarboxylate transporter substrate binding protein [Pseudorhodoferax sp.]
MPIAYKAPTTPIARRSVLRAGLAAAAASALGAPALASSFPNKPIQLQLPFPPGGMFDAVLRALAEAAAKDLGQPIVLMHRAGAGGVTGVSSLTSMGDADGYLLGVMHNSVIRWPHMNKVNWDPRTDFTYLLGLNNLTTGVAVAADAPWKTLAELLADAKAKPGQLSWGNVGAISVNRIYGERLGRKVGAKFNFIPFKGGNEQLTAVVGRHLDVYGDPGFGAMARSGKLRVLATFTEQRLAQWQSVPTMRDLGHDFVIHSPFGLVAPKNMDPAVRTRLESAFRKATDDPNYRRIADDFDLEPWVKSGEEYRQYAVAQYDREKQMLDEIGFKPE